MDDMTPETKQALDKIYDAIATILAHCYLMARSQEWSAVQAMPPDYTPTRGIDHAANVAERLAGFAEGADHVMQMLLPMLEAAGWSKKDPHYIRMMEAMTSNPTLAQIVTELAPTPKGNADNGLLQ